MTAPLATDVELASWLGYTFTAADELARSDLVLAGASDLVRRACGQTFTRVDDDVATITGRDGVWIHLPQHPVIDVTEVVREDIDDLGTTGPWTLVGNEVHRPAGWGGTRTRWTVTYSHGYNTIPADIVDIVCAVAARAWTNPAGLLSEAGADGQNLTHGGASTYSRGSLGLTSAEQSALDRYRTSSHRRAGR